MKSRRLYKFLQQKAAVKSKVTLDKQDIQTNSDQHIDQDFPGFPHAPAADKLITPKTKEDKMVAAIKVKDGEKIIPSNKKKTTETKEEESDGSASAFEGTETVTDDE